MMFQQQRWCESWGVRNAVQHAAVESGTCQFSPNHKSSREGMLLLQLKHTPAHSSPLVWWDGRQIKRSRTRTEQLPCCTVLRQFLHTAKSPSLYSQVFSFSALCSGCRKIPAMHVCLYTHVVYSMCFLLGFLLFSRQENEEQGQSTAKPRVYDMQCLIYFLKYYPERQSGF